MTEIKTPLSFHHCAPHFGCHKRNKLSVVLCFSVYYLRTNIKEKCPKSLICNNVFVILLDQGDCCRPNRKRTSAVQSRCLHLSWCQSWRCQKRGWSSPCSDTMANIVFVTVSEVNLESLCITSGHMWHVVFALCSSELESCTSHCAPLQYCHSLLGSDRFLNSAQVFVFPKHQSQSFILPASWPNKILWFGWSQEFWWEAK